MSVISKGVISKGVISKGSVTPDWSNCLGMKTTRHSENSSVDTRDD